MKSATELQREIQKTRQYLLRLETQLRKITYRETKRESEEERLQRLEREIRREYSNAHIDRSILKLVGTLPSRGSDSKLIAEAIDEKYAK